MPLDLHTSVENILVVSTVPFTRKNLKKMSVLPLHHVTDFSHLYKVQVNTSLNKSINFK